ncbi:flagellar basal body rod protein FlgC [Lentisphaerota bacterium WC36G]|nr:flagellar basal body rod protein FlgC [Lentisphaerae bacterium WC36]
MSSFELIPAIGISNSGLAAERKRMDVIANNLANANSTGSKNEVYRKKLAVFEAQMKDQVAVQSNSSADLLDGVKLAKVISSDKEPVSQYMPYHPKADKEGMVYSPNISVMEEMVDMIAATRAYEANLSVIKESRKMADSTINIVKG